MNLFSKIFVVLLIILGFFYFKSNLVDNFLNDKIDNVKKGLDKDIPENIGNNGNINKDNKEEMAITRDISGVNYYFNGKDAYFKDGYIYYNNKINKENEIPLTSVNLP